MALRELFASFGIEVDSHEIDEANTKLDSLVETIKHVAEGLALYKVGETLFEWSMHAAEAADSIGKTAQKIGVGSQALQKWQYAAGLADVSAETLTQTLGILAKNAEEASEGSKAQADNFRQLGVSIKDAAGNVKAPSELLLEVGDALMGVENPTKRVALALEVLGRGGKELLPLFKGGSEEISKLFKEFRESGAGFSDEFIEQSEEANDSITRMKVSLQGLRNLIAAQIVPVISRVVQWITAAIKKFREFVAGTELVKVSLAAFAATAAAFALKIAAAFALPLLKFGLIAGAIALIILVIEDLYQLFTGGESLIGAFIDKLFGIGTAGKVVVWFKEQFEELLFFMKESVGFIRKLDDFLNPFKDSEWRNDIKRWIGFDAPATASTPGAQGPGPDAPRLPPALAPTLPASAVSTSVTNAPNSNTVTNAPQITINAGAADAKEVGKVVQKVLAQEYSSAFPAVTTAGR